ncbi:FIP1[V]-like protein isoform X1 [Zingiber officinale]|uniref:Pre-mRNA polyadenylation factor Fip1 domain-containing protein n=1 Tax=Zingiber officinale TaxID=94328 RepID=A0A8J5HQ60_ZINOF|nr:FIP1[V]-like protein isoform X1 [Zingiber officinale]KAG6532897.1 hypothetical protein ZIOFF_006756 [Zingiber officinale]
MFSPGVSLLSLPQAMGSVEDDFEELYADLDDQVNAGIALAQGSCSGKEFDSISEGSGERPASCDDAGDLVVAVESESEDDLHIVLNEENCSRMMALERRNSGLGAGWCREEEDEDEDGDLVILTEFSQHRKNNLTRVEKLPITDGLAHGSATRSASQCVRSQIGGFPTKSITSVSQNGACDQLTIPLGVSASCNSCILSTSHNRHLFWPRKRTIFDINIEALEQKPWRQPRVDITDYFNFDLNEESWRSYCRELDQFRQQQAEMSEPFTVNESSRSNQFVQMPTNDSYECEYVHHINREKASVSNGNLDHKLRWLDMKKGRAIQVEHGIGERVPSTDIKQPRHRDSDVVIQVAMKDFEDCPAEESGHVEKGDRRFLGYVHGLHESANCENMGVQASSTIMPSLKTSKTNSKGISGAIDAGIPSNSDVCIQRAISRSQDSNISSSDCLSESSKYPGCSKKILNIVKQESTNSVARLQESNMSDSYYSNSYETDHTKSRNKDLKLDRVDLGLSPEIYRDHNQKKIHSTVELVTPAVHEEASTVFYNSSKNSIDKFEVGFRSEGKQGYNTDAGKHLDIEPRHRRSRNYKNPEHSVDNSSRKASSEVSLRKANYDETTKSRKASTEVSLRKANYDETNKRNLSERDCSHPKRVPPKDNRTYSTNFLFSEGYDGRVLINDPCEDSDELISESDSFILEKLPYLGHQKRKSDRQIMFKDGCKANARYRKHIASSSDDEELFSGKSSRHALQNSGGLSNLKRRRKINESHAMEMKWYTEHYVTREKRGLYGANTKRNKFSVTLKSSGQCVDDKQSLPIRNKKSRKNKYDSSSRSIDCQGYSYVEGNVALCPMLRRDDGDSFSNENIKFSGTSAMSGLQHLVDGEIYLRHQKQARLTMEKESPNFVKNSRMDKIQVNHHVVGYNHSEDHVHFSGRKKVITEEYTKPESTRGGRSLLENFDKERHDLGTLEHREPINLRVNGVKRKFHGNDNPDKMVTKRRSGAKRQRRRKLKNSIGIRHQEIAQSKLERKHQRLDGFKSVISIGNGTLAGQDHEDDEIEEGQLIEESDDDHVAGLLPSDLIPMKRMDFPVVKPYLQAQSEVKKVQTKETATNANNFGGCCNNRILEALTKMEKRRERFKEPIAPKQVEEKNLPIDTTPASTEVKEQRPARKRRWGASS